MATRTEHFTVEQSLPGERLDIFLRAKFPAVSRGAMQRLIEQGHIRVDGKTVKPTHSPRAGEKIEIHFPEPKPAAAQPEEIPLDILFEDKSLLVVNKPAGLVVHPRTQKPLKFSAPLPDDFKQALKLLRIKNRR